MLKVERCQFGHFLQGGRILVFQVAEFSDALLPFLDQRIELGNLDGVLALLLFPKAEKVCPIRRAPAVEEKFVLLPDGGAQRFFPFCVPDIAAGEGHHDVSGDNSVSAFCEMNSVLGQIRMASRSFRIFVGRVDPVSEQFNEESPARSSDIFESIVVAFKAGVVAAHCRVRSLTFFMANRPQQHKPHFSWHAGRGPADFSDRVHQFVHVRRELGNSCFAVERGRHSIAQKGHGRLHQRDLFLHSIEPFLLRLAPVEAGARSAHRRVRGPGEIAEGYLAVGKRRSEPRLDVSVVRLALEESVADKKHAVAIAEVEGRVRGGARAGAERREQREPGGQVSS